MDLEKITMTLKKQKFLIPIVVLTILTFFLIVQKTHSKISPIPDIELKNNLIISQEGLAGEMYGFVKFDNSKEQPKNLIKYYIIKPLNKFNESSRQYFSLEKIEKEIGAELKSLGETEIMEVSETYGAIVLEDEEENKFYIDKNSGEITIKKANGQKMSLITTEAEYKNFIKTLVKK